MASLADVPPEPGPAPLVGLPAELVGGRRSVASSWWRRALLLDLGSAACAVALTSVLLPWERRSSSIGWLLALVALVAVLAAVRGAYRWRMHLHVADAVLEPIVETGLAGLMVSFAWALVSLQTFRPRLFLVALVVVVCSLALARLALYRSELGARFRGESLRPTLIVGAGRVGHLVARRLSQHREYGLLPVAHLDDQPLQHDESGWQLPVLAGADALEAAVARYQVEQVVLAFSRASHERLLELTEQAAALGLDVALVPRLYEKTGRRISIGHLGGLPLLGLPLPRIDRSGYLRVKYALDRVFAALLLLLVLPAFAAALVAIWVTMGRPVFFRQIRLGRDEEPFLMLKLRTMAPSSVDELTVLAADSAPGGVEGRIDRRTRLGRFLRSSSLDELPQLVNVLKGEMSLIGPRPERPEYVRQFNAAVPGYSRRHRVKGGITGWAQVHGLRGKTSISDRAEWDNYYIDNLSPSLDLKIALHTLAVLLHGFGPVQ